MAEHQRIDRPPRTALIRGADREAIANVLFGDADTTPIGAAGRGDIGVFKIGDGEGVLRRCRRGGLVGKIVREGYVLKNRPLAEFHVHEYLYDAGVAVPEPLGVMWERRGLVVRGAIATRRLDAIGLAQAIADAGNADIELCDSVANSIRTMHDLGVYHADLNVDNILVGKDDVYLIDFDNASRHASLGPIHRARNLLRLRRSIQKSGLPNSVYDSILAAYGPIALPSWLDAVYRLKGKASDWLAAS